MLPAEIEKIVGIEGHAIPSLHIQGKFEKTPETFIVEEVPKKIPESPSGKYTILKIRLRNWDKNRFVLFLSSTLRVPRNAITYAGTKDKHSTSIQYFSIHGRITSLPSIDGIEYTEHYYAEHPIRLGDLYGNTFTVKVESSRDISDLIIDGFNMIDKAGGFPNFFGLQRFGSMRPVTHLVGKYILIGDFRRAFREYICDPTFDSEDYRLGFCSHEDPERALEEFPENLTFERMLLNSLRNTGSFERALGSLPRTLGMMFVHAYQSYVFNRALSERLRVVDALYNILPGDRVIPIDEYSNPASNMKPFICDRHNIEKLNRLSRENKVRSVITLPGFNTELTDSTADRIIGEILEEDGVDLRAFRVSGNKKFSSGGSFRTVAMIPQNFKIISPNTMMFQLGRGAYATMLLRELLQE